MDSQQQQQQQLEPDIELDSLLQGFDPSRTLVDDMAIDYTFLSSLFGDGDVLQPAQDSAPLLGSNTLKPDPATPPGPPPVAPELLPPPQCQPLEYPAAIESMPTLPQQQQQQSLGAVWASLADPQLEAPSMMHIQQLQALLTRQQDQRRRAAAAADGPLGSQPPLQSPWYPAAGMADNAAADMDGVGRSSAPQWGSPQQQQQQQQHWQSPPQPAYMIQGMDRASMTNLPGLPGLPMQQQQQEGLPSFEGVAVTGSSGHGPAPQSPTSAAWPAAWTQPPAAAAAAVPVHSMGNPSNVVQAPVPDFWQQQQPPPLHPPGGWPYVPAPMPQQQQQQQGTFFDPQLTQGLVPQQLQVPVSGGYAPGTSPPLRQGLDGLASPSGGLAAAGGGYFPHDAGSSRAPGHVITTAVETPAPAAGMQFGGGGRGRGRGRGRQQATADDGEPVSRFKRNRLRHKQNMIDMEAEVARKLQQLRALVEENSSLKTKAEVLDKVIQVRDKQLSVLRVAGPAVYKEPGDSAVSMEGRGASSSAAAAPPLLLPKQEAASASGQPLQDSASGELATIERNLASMSGDVLQAAANAGGNSRLIESAADVRSVSPQAAAAVVAVANAMAELQVTSTARRRGAINPAQPAMDSAQLAQTLTAAGVGYGGLSVWCAPERSGSGVSEPNSSGSGGQVVTQAPGRAGGGGGRPTGRSTASSRSRGEVSLQQQQQQQQQGSLPLLQEQASVGSAGSLEHHSAMSDLEQRLAAMPQLTAMFKDMPLVEGVRHWKWMLARLSTALLRWDQGDTSMAPRIKQTIANTGFTVLNMAVLNPDVMVRFASLNMETNTVCDSHQLHAHWDAVLGVMELAPAQVQEILKTLELLGPELVRQIKARRAVVTAWQAIAEETRALRCTLLEKKQTSSRCIELGLQLEKQLDAVQTSYRREYSTLVLLHGTLMDQILTPVQVARLLVHSFPYFPNGLAISLALARREKWTPMLSVEGAAGGAALGAPAAAPPLELMGSV